MIHLSVLFLAVSSSTDIQSPSEFQVFQRGKDGVGRVRVEGTCPGDLKALGALVRLRSDQEPKWHPLQVEPGRFHGVVELPAGGWYSLSLASKEGEPSLAEVRYFGVGEVFVVAGQSNSTNFGEERTSTSDDRVAAFDGTSWWLAADPMPGVQDASDGGSPWPICGELLRKSLGVPVAFASCGYGGTSLRQWQKGFEFGSQAAKVRLYDGLLQRVRALGEFRAILWHQGESDAHAGMREEEYVELFSKLQRDLAGDLGREAPWIVAHASFVPGIELAKMDAIRAAQAEIWKRGLALQGPDTDDLRGPLRHSRDHIHFSRAGLEVHAARWFAHVWAGCFADPPMK
ncbi:MAG: sialate O-acetylesterase [Planctomycetota bacterium]